MFSERVQSRAAQREATRQRVLSAAERLFRDQGFGATTVRRIAADAAVMRRRAVATAAGVHPTMSRRGPTAA
ncbi:TetR family transcriptional regulator [Streptomyces yunnanensis]|uniref:TetR family transcriptional regulator n=1 Tax=Streptomyces yunnanensis TaxID=156453 RepID=UPI003B830955